MEKPAAIALAPEIRRFLEQPNYATLATAGPDGTPHQAVIWYRIEADDRIMVNSRSPRRWPDELRRDGRCSLAVMDGTDGFRWVGLQLEVDETSSDVIAAREDIVALAYRYDDADEESIAAFRSQDRVSFRLRIVRVHDHLDA